MTQSRESRQLEALLKAGRFEEFNARVRCADHDLDLSEANLEGLDLRSTYCSYVNLEHINLARANLKGARLSSLSYVNLTDADLRFADLRNCGVSGIQVTGADFRGTAFSAISVINTLRRGGANLNEEFKQALTGEPTSIFITRRKGNADVWEARRAQFLKRPNDKMLFQELLIDNCANPVSARGAPARGCG